MKKEIYYCDICKQKITKKRMRRSTWLQRLLMDFSKYHFFADITDKGHVCANCMDSFNEWIELRRGDENK